MIRFHALLKKGFTLIELLVVIAIISLLASVILASLEGARIKARNTNRIADVLAYRDAIELAYVKNGEYPDPGDATLYCLGTYTGNVCLDGTYANSTTLDNTIKPFISRYPGGTAVGGITGYVYRCITGAGGSCSAYQVVYFLEGTSQACGPGALTNGNYLSLGVTSCLMVKS